MESFIVRIYRRREEEPREVAGLVELVEMNEQRPFADFEELRKILSLKPRKAGCAGSGKSRCPKNRKTKLPARDF